MLSRRNLLRLSILGGSAAAATAVLTVGTKPAELPAVVPKPKPKRSILPFVHRGDLMSMAHYNSIVQRVNELSLTT